MPSLFDWSTTAGSNTTVDGVNIAEGCPAANVNNAIRSTLALIRASFSSGLQTFLDGTAALPVANGGTGGTTAAAARTALGVAASGANTDITSLSAPALGAATATTATGGTNTTQVATTAFVTTALTGKAASGANTDITSLSAPALGAATATTAAAKTSTTQVATTAFVDGLRSLLSSATSGTLVLSDRGTLVPITANIAVPNSVFSGNDVVTIYNNSAGSLTITASITTLRLGGTATTGNRTLAQRGIATIVFISGTEAVISGAGVT